MIRIIAGDWYLGRASLSLVRARLFFSPQTLSNVPYDLMMDYWTADKKDDSAATKAQKIANRGGYYQTTQKACDAPPEAVETSRRSAGVTYPFDSKVDPSSPVRYLFLNETSKGGFYPLGLGQNIHGGIHLTPEDSSSAFAPVRSFGPGYVVAARLAGGLPRNLAGGDRMAGTKKNTLVEDLAGGSNAFVMVRHVIEEVLPPGDAGTPKEFTIYSLTMHLALPDWSKDELAREYAQVPWLNKLVRRRNGSVTVIDPTLPEGGQTAPTVLPVETKLVSGGTMQTYGESFAVKASFSCGPVEGGRTTAICRPADPDIKEALDALASGKVLTFCEPALIVDRGETLGLVSSDKEKFLHWEVLAPAGAKGGLDALLGFASEKLGLGAGFFPMYKEKSENNFFDPKDNELTSLLSFLPNDDGADKTTKLDPEYEPPDVLKLLNRADGLVFSTGAKAGSPAEEMAYPLTLAFDDFKGAMPAGEQTLKMRFEPAKFPERTVKFDPKKGKVDVMVPAGAKKIILESGDFFIELAGANSTVEEDAAHLKRLASARLRKVVLEHLNSWSKDGLLEEMKARFENEAEELTPYAVAASFWANDEKAVLGPSGSEKPLFAASPDAEQLPEKSKLVHAHPVIVGWVLNLLVKHGFARFKDQFPTPRGTEAAEKLTYLGWMPAYSPPRKRSVGDTVHAVAVAAGEVSGSRDLVLQAKVKGASKPLVVAKGRYVNGVLSIPTACPFWGEVTLEAEGLKPQLDEHLQIEVLEPVPGEPAIPTKDTAGNYVFSLPFAKNRPKRIEGFVVMKTWVVGAGKNPEGDGQEAGVAIPIEALVPAASPADLTYDATGQFIVGAKKDSVSVSTNFTFGEYKKAAGGTISLARVLASGVQKLRTAYGVAQTQAKAGSGGLSLVALASTGLTIKVKCATESTKNHERLVAAAQALAAEFQSVEDLGKEIRLSVVLPPASTGGMLVASFDPAAAFSKMLADKPLGPTDEMHIRFGVVFQNGGRCVRPFGADVPGKGFVEVKPEDLRKEAATVEAWAPVSSAILHKPQFGAITKSISGETLSLSVQLFGGAKDWAAAKPQFAFKTKAGKDETIGGKSKSADCVAATIGLNDPRIAASKIKFEAKVTKENALFDGQKLTIEPVSMDVDTTPKLEAPEVTWTATDVEVRCKTQSFPTNRVVEVVVYKQESTGEVDLGVMKAVAFQNPYKKYPYQGFPDDKGVIVARVPRKLLSKWLAVDDEIRVEVRRPKGYEKVFETQIDPVGVKSKVPAN